MITLKEFRADRYANTFQDVLKDPRIDFNIVFDFFNNNDRITRMENAELHHNRPALSGVIKEFEALPAISYFFQNHSAQSTMRFKQAVGVLVLLHMEKKGWRRTGKKGSLSIKKYYNPKTHKPTNDTKNTYGLANWFKKAEKYIKL